MYKSKHKLEDTLGPLCAKKKAQHKNPIDNAVESLIDSPLH